MLFLNSHVSSKDVTDGTTHTIYVGERLGDTTILRMVPDLGWMSGTRATLRNTGTPIGTGSGSIGAEAEKGVEAAGPASGYPAAGDKALAVGGFGSDHAMVSNFLFGDGAVHSLNNQISPTVLQQLGHRADGKLLTEGPTRTGPP